LKEFFVVVVVGKEFDETKHKENMYTKNTTITYKEPARNQQNHHTPNIIICHFSFLFCTVKDLEGRILHFLVL
jgi:hypothetical protein